MSRRRPESIPYPVIMVMDGGSFKEAVVLIYPTDGAAYRDKIRYDAATNPDNFENEYAVRIKELKALLADTYPLLDPEEDFILCFPPIMPGIIPTIRNAPIANIPAVVPVSVPVVNPAPPSEQVIPPHYATQGRGRITNVPVIIGVKEGEVIIYRGLGFASGISTEARNYLLESCVRASDKPGCDSLISDYAREIYTEVARLKNEAGGQLTEKDFYVSFYPHGVDDRLQLIGHAKFSQGGNFCLVNGAVAQPDECVDDRAVSLYTGHGKTSAGFSEELLEYQAVLTLTKACKWHKEVDFSGQQLAEKLAERPVVIYNHGGKIHHRKLDDVHRKDGVVDKMQEHATKLAPNAFITKYIKAVCRTLIRLKKDYPDMDMRAVLISLEPSMERSMAVYEHRAFYKGRAAGGVLHGEDSTRDRDALLAR